MLAHAGFIVLCTVAYNIQIVRNRRRYYSELSDHASLVAESLPLSINGPSTSYVPLLLNAPEGSAILRKRSNMSQQDGTCGSASTSSQSLFLCSLCSRRPQPPEKSMPANILS